VKLTEERRSAAALGRNPTWELELHGWLGPEVRGRREVMRGALRGERGVEGRRGGQQRWSGLFMAWRHGVVVGAEGGVFGAKLKEEGASADQASGGVEDGGSWGATGARTRVRRCRIVQRATAFGQGRRGL
jgi:hypothetical protein